MEPLHYILIGLVLIYLLMGGIFVYFSLSYRKQYKRIRKATNIIIRDVNEALTKIDNELKGQRIELTFVPFEFASDNDDFIEENREKIYGEIDKARGQAGQLNAQVKDSKVQELIQNQIATVEDNLANYRRLVIKHNKIVDNYNFNTRSIFFYIFAIMINLKKEKHI